MEHTGWHLSEYRYQESGKEKLYPVSLGAKLCLNQTHQNNRTIPGLEDRAYRWQ